MTPSNQKASNHIGDTNKMVFTDNDLKRMLFRLENCPDAGISSLLARLDAGESALSEFIKWHREITHCNDKELKGCSRCMAVRAWRASKGEL